MAVHTIALITRWIARITSILSLLTVLVFAVGDITGGSALRPSPQESIGLALWPIGVAVGLILAWFHECLGGTLALASLVAFHIWNFLGSGHLPNGPFFVLIAAPALIFLIAASLSRRVPHSSLPLA